MKSPLVGACLLGVVLLLSACASPQAAEPTPTDVAFPTYPVVTPYPTSTAFSPATTPNPAATAAALAGCSTGNASYFEPPPGPLPTTIPLPPGTLVGNFGMGISGGSAAYSLCTPGATPTAITAYMDSALPAAGWTSTSPPGCNVPPGLWYKGHYGIQVVVAGFSPPDMWALDIWNYGTSGC
jgi:hypothetical protein